MDSNSWSHIRAIDACIFWELDFTVERKQTDPLVLLDEPLPGAPRHVCTKVRANVRKTDCVGPILSQIERRKSNMH